MVTSGYSGTPLPRKLGIKDGFRVVTIGAPPDFQTLLSPLHPSVSLRGDLRAKGPFNVIIIFVTSHSELRRRFDGARAKLAVAGGLWVAWPKLTSPLAGELRGSHVRAYGLSTGLVDNKVCAIDEDWSGLRFVVRKEDRDSWPVLVG
jgi:hypothetical protein